MENYISQHQKTAETKERIYQAAWKLLSEYGPENISVRQITHEAGVSIGTFYHHYDSKDDLVNTFRNEMAESFNFLIEFDAQKDTPQEVLQQYFSRYVEGFTQSKVAVDRIVEVFLSQDKNKVLKLRKRNLYINLINIIQAFQGAGKMTDTLAAQNIADDLVLCARGVLYDWFLNDAKIDFGERMQEIIGRILCFYVI